MPISSGTRSFVPLRDTHSTSWLSPKPGHVGRQALVVVERLHVPGATPHCCCPPVEEHNGRRALNAGLANV
jgi:hypothetical protein